jgi:aspartyl-tRNA(Asn)/glutamyl-tRNA(Gln) amidotransferase subunit B
MCVPVCLGLPGSLPVLNARAVEMAVGAALALDCTIRERSIFARKNYFYPDLPKGYQISQYEEPFSERGKLEIDVGDAKRSVGITRVHMEEDAGKNVHGVGGDSLVDLNRAGVPLIEIVGDPDLRSSAEAVAYLRALRDILVFVGVNDGNLEEGSFRCDANVSIRPKGSTKFGTRCELKNINSFRFVQRAIEVEIARQTAILDAGGTVRQETRSFDPDSDTTKTLRSKEEAHDYRYFPEPDLPPLRLEPAFVAKVRGALPERARLRRANGWWPRAFRLRPAQTITLHPGYLRFFDALTAAFPHAQKAANFFVNEVLRGAKSHGLDRDLHGQRRSGGGAARPGRARRDSGKQAKDVYAGSRARARARRVRRRARDARRLRRGASCARLCERVVREVRRPGRQLPRGQERPARLLRGPGHEGDQRFGKPKLVSELLEKVLG